MTFEEIEQKISKKMCVSCPHEKECHDNCEHCDEYYDEVAWEQVMEDKRKEQK